jgi:hypothetical protein
LIGSFEETARSQWKTRKSGIRWKMKMKVKREKQEGDGPRRCKIR